MESTPLLIRAVPADGGQSLSHRYTEYSTPNAFSIKQPSPLRSNEESAESSQEIPKFCCRNLFLCISRCLGRHRKCFLWIKYLSEFALANSFIACIFILFMKAYDENCFKKWSNGYMAVLGNWNLQIADFLLVLSYAMTDFLQLRLCLSVACIGFVIYALTSPIGIMVDMGVFNFVMALLNLRHASELVYRKRHIEFPEEQEQIYTSLFSQYMTRVQFKALADISVIRQNKAGVTMKEIGDLVTSLCIIVKGQVEVRRKEKILNVLYKNDILEAPEWLKSNLDPEGIRFTVSFTTVTNVVYIKYTRELLSGILVNDDAIRSAVLAVLGIRVSEL